MVEPLFYKVQEAENAPQTKCIKYQILVPGIQKSYTYCDALLIHFQALKSVKVEEVRNIDATSTYYITSLLSKTTIKLLMVQMEIIQRACLRKGNGYLA